MGKVLVTLISDHYHIQYISMVEIHISCLVLVSMSLNLGGTNERNSDGTFESNSAPKPTQHIHLFHRQVNDYYLHHYFLLHHYHHHQHDHQRHHQRHHDQGTQCKQVEFKSD